MKWWWRLSLIVLILGNIVDGCVTLHHLLCRPDTWGEANLLALWAWGLLGMVPAVVLLKLLFHSLILLAIWVFLSKSRLYDPWVRMRLSTFYGFFFGILLVLGGTGVVSILTLKVVLVIFPSELVLAHQEVLPTIFWATLWIFGGLGMGGATAVLLALNNKHLANED